MNFSDLVANMYVYWLLGAFIFLAVYLSDYRNLLRIDKKPLKRWIVMLLWMTAGRILLFALFKGTAYVQNAHSMVDIICWQQCFTVAWEDLAFSLPIVLFGKLIGDRIYWRLAYYLVFSIFMVAFGVGHLYQGIIPAIAISLYIPFSVKRGQSWGFGTLAVCHTLYDLFTWISIRSIGMF